MLNYAVITLALLGATICQAYNKDTLELLRAFGMRPIRHHDPHAWKYVETVGAGEGCCFPDKMEAQTSFILGSVQKGKPEIRQGYFNISLDGKLGIVFYDGFLTVNGHRVHAKMWYDDNKNMLYTIVKGGKAEHCIKSRFIPDPWALKCIPAGTKKLGKAYYGNQKGPNRVDVTWYEFDRKEGHSDYQAYASYTNTTQQNQCILVTVAQYGTSKGVPYTMATDFTNIVTELKNPNVFKIPSICKKDNGEAVPTEYSGIDSILFC